MIKFSVEKWDKNKGELEKDIRANLKTYNDYSYKDLVKKVVVNIFNTGLDEYEEDFYDAENITEIDNGDYQGTLLYIIPVKTYQPSEYEYLMTYVGYGSCSGCDTLQSIQMWSYFDDEEDKDETDAQSYKRKEEFVNDMMKLCLELVQNTIKPYNTGWRAEEKFDQVED